MKKITEAGELKGKRVLVRVDFNVPLQGGTVGEIFRVEKVLPTINFLKEKGAKIILLSHIQDKDKNVLSLRPVFEYLKKQIPESVFAPDFLELEKQVGEITDGGVILFENLRLHRGEKENDANFAKKLASLGDIYVNDAFSVSHRRHASVVGLPKFLPSFIGLLFDEEVKNLSLALNPAHPFLFILGGAKTETKLPLLEKFAKTADYVFVGGVLANDFLKAEGFEVGQSLVSEGSQKYSQILQHHRIVLPEKVVAVGENGEQKEKTPDDLEATDSIKDVVIADFENLRQMINQSKFILWNGPMGDLESGFKAGTQELANLLIQSSAKTIVGGGDTLSALDQSILEKFSFVSTAGGAMLDFLANETLPGIEENFKLKSPVNPGHGADSDSSEGFATES